MKTEDTLDYLGQVAAGVKASLAMMEILEAWEKKEFMRYGFAVARLIENTTREQLTEGLECNGWRFYVDDEVGMSLKLSRVN